MIFFPGHENTEEISGVLVVDKEKGMTSHDVVDIVRKRFMIKKVGHAGTFDPNATGVLVLLIGKATKLSGRFMSDDKMYRALMKLGERTDSGDAVGTMIRQGMSLPDVGVISEVMMRFVGDIEQIPPMFSAKKKGGERLYKMARRGEVVERNPVKVTVRSIDIRSIDLPEIEFDVLCTKGTYIRQLADDIGERLGCGAHLLELRRLSSGDFKLTQAVAISKLMKMTRENFNENIIRV